MARRRVIIDTDPGVDDVSAMLLALSATADEIEVVMISVTYGNVPLSSTLKNVLSLIRVIEKERNWRAQNGIPSGYEALLASKPIVAAGPERPLEDEELKEDGFHGVDGLHGIQEAQPHLSLEETWEILSSEAKGSSSLSSLISISNKPAHKEMLRILKENPEDSITICALGPLTSLATAAAEDPEVFIKAKEIIVMGGAIDVPGNATPTAEFNSYADPVAAARVFALTSPNPTSTMPVVINSKSNLPDYPESLSRRLRLSLMPLDLTTKHELTRNVLNQTIDPLVAAGSPLALWVNHFLSGAFDKSESLGETGLALHDPLTTWYALTSSNSGWKRTEKLEDIRVETSGQWTYGMHVVDRRVWKKQDITASDHDKALETGGFPSAENLPGDEYGWINASKGNRISRFIESPDENGFGEYLLKRIFG